MGARFFALDARVWLIEQNFSQDCGTLISMVRHTQSSARIKNIIWCPQPACSVRCRLRLANSPAEGLIVRKSEFWNSNFYVGPSPDWLVGIDSLNLCLSNCSWTEKKEIDLLPFDAGTDSGVTYMVFHHSYLLLLRDVITSIFIIVCTGRKFADQPPRENSQCHQSLSENSKLPLL